jgi:hypothetical protein
MSTNEILIIATNKKELLSIVKKHGVSARKNDSYERESRGATHACISYVLRAKDDASMYNCIDELERKYEALDGGNYDEHYFTSVWVYTAFSNERNSIMSSLEATIAAERTFRAHVLATATAKAQELKWTQNRNTRLAA